MNAPALRCDNDLARSLPNMTTAADKLHSFEVSDEFALRLHTPATFMQVAINVNGFARDRFAEIFHLEQPEASSHGPELSGCNRFPASRELNILKDHSLAFASWSSLLSIFNKSFSLISNIPPMRSCLRRQFLNLANNPSASIEVKDILSTAIQPQA
jgi:hypothetical protein